MRLLISARDAGAAAHMAEIVPALRVAADIEVILVADEPALSYLQARGLKPRPFTAGSIAAPDNAGAEALRSAARQLLDEVKPDALLVGLSGPGVGIDEALLAEAPALPTYAVQDYPGWVVEGFGVKPGTFFVNDRFAADMTQSQLKDARVIITGSAKHAAYARLDPPALQKTGRAKLGAHGQHVGFYGQPAWFLAGYERAVTDFALALSAIGASDPFYRPHPKETGDDRARMQSIFTRAGLTLRLDPNATIEQSLCAADLVVTCFSSCGADQIHLQRLSETPLGVVLYLFTENELRRHHSEHAGSEIPLYPTMGLASLATDRNKIAADLREALNPATSKTMWQRARRIFPDSTATLDVLLTVIREDLALRSANTTQKHEGESA